MYHTFINKHLFLEINLFMSACVDVPEAESPAEGWATGFVRVAPVQVEILVQTTERIHGVMCEHGHFRHKQLLVYIQIFIKF